MDLKRAAELLGHTVQKLSVKLGIQANVAPHIRIVFNDICKPKQLGNVQRRVRLGIILNNPAMNLGILIINAMNFIGRIDRRALVILAI